MAEIANHFLDPLLRGYTALDHKIDRLQHCPRGANIFLQG
jgi:hypothetical protein